jgi:outer membrane protein assembly factor BamB
LLGLPEREPMKDKGRYLGFQSPVVAEGAAIIQGRVSRQRFGDGFDQFLGALTDPPAEHLEAICCLDLADGRVRWRKCFPAENRHKPQGYPNGATPVIYSGKVFCLISYQTVIALNLADGRELWRAECRIQRPDYGASAGWAYLQPMFRSPVVADGVLVVPMLECVTGYDPETGAVRWQWKDKGSTSTPGLWRCDGEDVVLLSEGKPAKHDSVGGKNWIAARPGTGEVLWTMSGGGSSPVVLGDIMLDGGLSAWRLGKAGGQAFWRKGVYQELAERPPIAAGPYAFVAPHPEVPKDQPRNARVMVFELTTGKVVAEIDLPVPVDRCAPALAADDKVFFLTHKAGDTSGQDVVRYESGLLMLQAAPPFAVLGQCRIPCRPFVVPALAGGVLVTADMDRVHGLDLSARD